MYFNTIVGVDIDFGISKNGQIPWKNKEDLQFFQKCTAGGVLLCTRNTYEDMRQLDGTHGRIVRLVKPDELGRFLAGNWGGRTVWVCGGQSLYEEALRDYGRFCQLQVISLAYTKSHGCDRFYPRFGEAPVYSRDFHGNYNLSVTVPGIKPESIISATQCLVDHLEETSKFHKL